MPNLVVLFHQIVVEELTGIPQLNMNTVDVTGKANLWKFADRATSLNLTGGVSKIFGGHLDGQTNKHVGVGLSHNF